MDNLFKFLDFILKKWGSDPIVDTDTVPPFILNRWISMTTPTNAMIVNLTHNRWNNVEGGSDFIKSSRFYRTVLPTTNKNASYIKKSEAKAIKVDKDDINYFDPAIICRNMDISMREYISYNKTLAELEAIGK